MEKLKKLWAVKSVKYGVKVVGVALIVIVYMILDNPDPESKVFVYEEPGYKEEVKFTYQKDEVLEENSKITASYAEMGFTDAEEAESYLSEFEATCNETEGLTMDFNYQEDGFVQTMNIDYEIIDLQELVDLEIVEIDGEPEDGVSMERTEEGYLEDGYKLKEKK